MLTGHPNLRATVSALSLLLAACGGGGGEVEVASSPPPPQSPTPTPTPSQCSGAQCLKAVDIFPDVKATTQFATLGLEASKPGVAASSLTRDGFSVQYNAEAGVYVFSVPSSAPGGFYENIGNTPNDRYWNGEIAEAPNVAIGASVFQPRATNPEIQLTYTTYAMYGSPYGDGPFGFVAFGRPTAAGSIPVSGSATYNAAVEGATLRTGDYIKGNATLQFDFGNGTLAGHFDPVIYDLLAYGPGGLSLGRYDFTKTVYGAGATSFSGELSQAGLTANGAFEGSFTGPQAEELMARWTAPFNDPRTHTNSEMFGVLVGRRP